MSKPKMIHEYLCYPKLLRSMSKISGSKGQLLSFGEHKSQHIILHIPSKVTKSILIVYVHGGGWRNGSPEGFAAIGDFFAKQGFVTAMLGYRKAPNFKHPCQIDDIGLGLQKAIESIKEITCEKIVVIGSSSGVHLGALLCLDKKLHKKYNLKTEAFHGFCSLSGILSFDDCLALMLSTISSNRSPVYNSKGWFANGTIEIISSCRYGFSPPSAPAHDAISSSMFLSFLLSSVNVNYTPFLLK